MIYKGMSVARLNMSHGTHEDHEKSIENIRTAAERYKRRTNYNAPVAVAVDLRGQEIRIGKIPKQFEAIGLQVNIGDKIRFHNNPLIADEPLPDMIFIDHSFIDKTLKRKHEILIDDGKLSFIVEEIYSVNATCKANKVGVLRSFQSVFIPAIKIDLNLPIVSEKDAKDLEFAVKNNVDFIFVSYVESQEWIDEIRARLGKTGRKIEVFAKIQSLLDSEKLDEILDKADGIILKPSVEIEPKHTKLFEYFVLNKCKTKLKPCFTIFEANPLEPTEICQAVNWKIDAGDGQILTQHAAVGKENPLRSMLILEGCRTLKNLLDGSEVNFERKDVYIALASVSLNFPLISLEK